MSEGAGIQRGYPGISLAGISDPATRRALTTIDSVFKSLFPVSAQAIKGQNVEYVITNVVTDREYDRDATDLAEIADVLGTLIADLQAAGIIK